MAYRDIVDRLKVVQSIFPQVLTGTMLTGSTGADTRDYDSALLIFNTGAAGTGTFTPSVHESDDDTTYTAVAAADLQGTALTTLSASGVVKIGYIGSKRYIKPSVAFSAGAASLGIAASVVLGNAHREAVS